MDGVSGVTAGASQTQSATDSAQAAFEKLLMSFMQNLMMQNNQNTQEILNELMND